MVLNEYIKDVWVKANVMERRKEVNKTFRMGEKQPFLRDGCGWDDGMRGVSSESRGLGDMVRRWSMIDDQQLNTSKRQR